MTANERLRRRYRPDEVRVLFIGESPPAGGTFFYRANSTLYEATREAFEAAIPALRREDDFLAAFQWLGCYLDDLCLVSVNHLDMRDPARLAERRRGIAPLARRMKPLAPRVLCIVMKDIVPVVGDAATGAGLDAQREPLPFPGATAHSTSPDSPSSSRAGAAAASYCLSTARPDVQTVGLSA